MLGSRGSSQRSRDLGQDWYLPVVTVLALCVASCSGALASAVHCGISAICNGAHCLMKIIPPLPHSENTYRAMSLRVTQLDQTWAALEQGCGNAGRGRWESGPADSLGCM